MVFQRRQTSAQDGLEEFCGQLYQKRLISPASPGLSHHFDQESLKCHFGPSTMQFLWNETFCKQTGVLHEYCSEIGDFLVEHRLPFRELWI